jgi:hypothetical protein
MQSDHDMERTSSKHPDVDEAYYSAPESPEYAEFLTLNDMFQGQRLKSLTVSRDPHQTWTRPDD